jgi:hypothetical protein
MKMLKMEIMTGWRMVKAKRIGKRQVLKLQQMYKFLFVTVVREFAVPIDVHTYPLPRQLRNPLQQLMDGDSFVGCSMASDF